MKKNYNYNFENRKQPQGSSVGVSGLEVASCTASSLKNSPVVNGRVWHTTDTNEFYYDWNGKRTKLSLTGDNANLEAEINRLKAKVNALDVDTVQNKINQLETKVNNAASQANTAKTAAQQAKTTAQTAAQQAQEAADQVADKASTSYVDDAVAHAFDNLTAAQKEELRGPAGADGRDGVDGAPGADGKDGKDGVDGQDGAPGRDGVDGAPGAPGRDGKDGKDGVDGQDGAPGKDGVDGKDGEDGITPHIGQNGNWFIGDTDTNVKAAGDGLSQEDRDKIDSIPDNLEMGAFPDGSDPEGSEFTPGLATVQDVIDYVNALIEKKKDDLAPVADTTPYAYITGYEVNGTATDITVFNPFELNEEGDTEIVVMASNELSVWNPESYEDLPAIKFTVDIPSGYTITEGYIWNAITNQYDDLMADNRRFATNSRYATRTINGVTYNSYVRGPVSDTTARGEAQYKIIITKQ